MSARATLRGGLARLVALTSIVTLVTFCAVAWTVIYLEDQIGLKLLPEADDDAPAFLLLVVALAGPVSLAIAVAAARWLARRAVRPIEQVIGAAGAMSVDRLDHRLPLPDREDELHDMVRTLNGLFARLEAGFEGLRSFAADASHELRTPLAAALSELEVALRRPRAEAEWRQAAERALAELRRMVQLVDGLLELARGGIAGPREPVDAGALLDEVIGTFAARAERAGLRLERAGDEPLALRVNRGALAAALGALVGNAIRYTPRGGRVELSAARGEAGRLFIRVDDSGPGVPREERADIFTPLRRGAAGLAADRGGDGAAGLGLGLAIARRAAEQHGGALEVTDSPLGGARFTLALPGDPS